MSYTMDTYNQLKTQYSHQPEFLQAVLEVLESVKTIVDNKKEYRKKAILEKLCTPNRILEFSVPWVDDKGQHKVNNGYRVQFDNTLGPYKGGLRFHSSVNTSVLKFLGFEQVFKNSLSGLRIGGAKGGADFDPKNKSDNEILAFCTSFITSLYNSIGSTIDVPAGDIGVGSRELGYMYGAYKRLTHSVDGTITGKAVDYGGSVLRKEATGYGLIYIIDRLLQQNHASLKNKTVSISGSGNVAIYAAEKAYELGAKVIAMSDSDGYILDTDGIDLKIIKDLKELKRGRISEYINSNTTAKFFKSNRNEKSSNTEKISNTIWDIPVDIALPCATQNELDLDDMKTLIKNGVKIIAEGANMPTTTNAIKHLRQHNSNVDKKQSVILLPGKAANAGGVATSAFEMMQNSTHQQWSYYQVDNMLKTTMDKIFDNIVDTDTAHKCNGDYIKAANIYAFYRVTNARLALGV